jgi:hypothetical protein
MTQAPNNIITQSHKDTKKEIIPFPYLCAFAALRDNFLRSQGQDPFIRLRLQGSRRCGVMTQAPNIFITQRHKEGDHSISLSLRLCGFA